MTITRLIQSRSNPHFFASFISVAACVAACDAPDGLVDSEVDDGGGDLDDDDEEDGVPAARRAQALPGGVGPAAEFEYAACELDPAAELASRPDDAVGGPLELELSAKRFPAVAPPPVDTAPDYTTLVAGATSVLGGGQPSMLALTSASAFPLLIDESKRVFAAAGRVGLGKVVVFGHESYMNATVKTADNNKILANAVAWAASKPAPVIGVASSLPSVVTALKALGYTVQTVTPGQLGGVNVYLNTTYPVYTEAEYESIRQFVANGGGLIVGGQGWSWAPPANATLLDYSGNRMLRGSGIYITPSSAISAGTDTVTAAPPTSLLNASVALARLTDHANNVANLSLADQNLAVTAVESAVSQLPLIVKEFYDQTTTFAAGAAPTMTTNTPFEPASKPGQRLAVRLQAKLALEQPVAEIKAHVLSADFPGAISNAIPRETVQVTINGNYAGRDSRYAYSGAGVPVWRSTGVYAAPGELVKIKIPASLAAAGLTAQIGAHTDLLWNKTSWIRFPEIVRTYPLNAAEVTIASAFGGLVYIRVPGGKQLGPVDVTVENVVRAPYYVHGQTTQAEWLTIRDYPAPWAEIASEKIIVMVPSSFIKNLADPAPLMNLWDQVMDAQADLGVIPYDRVRPERYLIDRDISAGYMHSGYPIMAPYAEAANLVSVAKLTAGNWGFWHEVGHNHQWSGWVLAGTTESNVNLFSIYVSEVLLGIPRAVAHSALKPASRAQRAQTYRANGKVYANWGSDAWLPLEMYLQLQEGFGWNPYKAVFGAIQALSPAATPANDQARIDAFTLRFAQNVNKNLGPFFKEGWGIPVSQSALDTMAALPVWNDSCASAVNPGVLGQTQGPLTLASDADVDWFFFDAPANAIGKKVRVVTAPGDAQTDTVVEVFQGECIVQTTLGGPSDDINFHENWLSASIAAAGRIYVKVSYSNSGYLDDQYKLTVTFE